MIYSKLQPLCKKKLFKEKASEMQKLYLGFLCDGMEDEMEVSSDFI